MSQRRNSLLIVAAAVLAGAGAGAATYAALPDKTATTRVAEPVTGVPARTADQSLREVSERAAKGVVEITTVGTSEQDQDPFPFDGPNQQRGQGSGFVYDEQGHVITNQHVVAGADSVSVRFANGATYRATVVGSDASTDLAVLDVDAPESLLQPLALGDSGELEVGDGVVAIGSPFGLEGTVTSGIVSALDREMTAPNDFVIDGSIQTDAAVNRGNSGGPLLNMSGEVVGVIAQVASASSANAGVAFAISSNTARPVVSQLLDDGEVEHPYLGVGLVTIPESVADRLGSAAGAAITEVRPGTPAARASLRAATGSRTVGAESYPTGGDVITALDGQRVQSADDLRERIERKRPGDEVTLTAVRDGETRTVRVTLGTRPS